MKHRLMALLALALLLAGCSFSAADPTSPTPAAPLVIEAPEGGTVTIRMAEDVGALQPWAPATRGAEQIVGLLYRGLTRLDARLAPQPDLATSWVSDRSGRTLTMTLRTDVAWHDGTPLTADDVVWTLGVLREISPTTTLLADLQRVVVDVQSPRPDALVLTLKEPYAPILAELSTPILPKHIFGSRPPQQLATSDFWLEPVGSGPFRFEARQPGQSVALVRNPADPIQVPFLDRVAFLVAPEPAVVRQALIDGTLQGAELPWETARTLSTTSALKEPLQFGAYPENGFYALAFNTRPGHPFSSPAVRQALWLTLDGDLLRQAAGEGATLISSDHLSGTWAASPQPTPAAPDLAQARTLLTQAGWILPDGATVRASNGITLAAALYVRGDDPRRLQVAEQVAQAGRRVGIELTVTPSDFESAFKPRLAPPFDFEIILLSWASSRVRSSGPSYAAYDPDNFALFHSSQIYQGPADGRQGLRNFGGFSSSSYDNLAAAARALYATDRRRDLYRQIDTLLDEEKPYIYLWADQVPVMLAPTIHSARGPIDLSSPRWVDEAPFWYIQP